MVTGTIFPMSKIERKKKIYLIIIVIVLMVLAIARGIMYVVRSHPPSHSSHPHSTKR
jgi:flagellar basal body-associated protein FliL